MWFGDLSNAGAADLAQKAIRSTANLTGHLSHFLHLWYMLMPLNCTRKIIGL